MNTTISWSMRFRGWRQRFFLPARTRSRSGTGSGPGSGDGGLAGTSGSPSP
ncbi:MAG: hypothetical protein L6W00_29510 [Lentisphaeria bacterium]|nr:MAG: hypothetical protein L6W00_29510 [Lentisphaeria bacterium]